MGTRSGSCALRCADPTLRSSSMRRWQRRLRCTSRVGTSTRRCFETSKSASSSVHINQFGFRPGVGRGTLRRGAAHEGERRRPREARSRSARLATPTGSSRAFYDRLVAGRCRRAGGFAQLRYVRQRSRLWRGAPNTVELPPTRAHRSSQACRCRRENRMGRRCRHRGSLRGRTLPRPVPTADRPRRVAAPARIRRELLVAGRCDFHPGTEPALPRTRRRSGMRYPPGCLHNAPGGRRPITTAIRDLLDGARETLDVVNPYVTDKGMIRRHRERRSTRRPRSPLRASEREQLGVRGCTTLPP